MFHFSSHRSSKLRGFTLTELAIVLGVMGLILGGIWAAASAVLANSRARVMTDTLMIIVDNAHSFFSNSNQLPAAAISRNSYTATLATAGVFPKSTLDKSNMPFGLWPNSNIYIWGSSSVNFRLTIDNVPKDYCSKIIMGMLGANGLTKVKLPSGTWKTNSTADPIKIAETTCTVDLTDLGFEFSMHYAPM